MPIVAQGHEAHWMMRWNLRGSDHGVRIDAKWYELAAHLGKNFAGKLKILRGMDGYGIRLI